MVDPEALDRALDEGALDELPAAVPTGLMGDGYRDLRAVDDAGSGLGGGLIQESTPETRWMSVALLYVLVITAPAAVWLLWREKRWSVRAKAIFTVLGLLGYAGLYVLYSLPVA